MTRTGTYIFVAKRMTIYEIHFCAKDRPSGTLYLATMREALGSQKYNLQNPFYSGEARETKNHFGILWMFFEMKKFYNCFEKERHLRPPLLH